MEIRKSGMSTTEELIGMLKNKTGVKDLKNDDDLQLDIGLTGDDAFEFISDYSKNFNVDISKFLFNEYFYDEGEYLIFLKNKIFGKYQKKKLTISHLLRGLEEGYIC